MLNVRKLVLSLGVLGLLVSGGTAEAAWPERPVTIISHSAPGAINDLLTMFGLEVGTMELVEDKTYSRGRVCKGKVKDVLNVGDEVEARVIKVDTDERRIGLSIKAVGENFSPEDLKAAEEEYTAALKPGEAMVDMGEVFSSEAMAGLKLD